MCAKKRKRAVDGPKEKKRLAQELPCAGYERLQPAAWCERGVGGF